MNSLLCSTCWISEMDITLHYMQHHPPGSSAWMHYGMLMKPQRRDCGENCSNQDMHMSMLPRREFFMKQETSIVRNVLFIYITSLNLNFCTSCMIIVAVQQIYKHYLSIIFICYGLSIKRMVATFQNT